MAHPHAPGDGLAQALVGGGGGWGHGGSLAGVRRGVALVGEKLCRDAMPSFTPSAPPGGVPTVPSLNKGEAVRTFSAVIERCADTGLLVGYVPGFPGAHSQAETLEELQVNLLEVIAMLLEDGEPAMESDFVGLQQIVLPA